MTSGDNLVQPLVLKQGQLEQVAEDWVQFGFEYLHGWRFHNVPDHLVVFDNLMTKKVFLILNWSVPVVSKVGV